MNVDLSEELKGYADMEFDSLDERVQYLISKLVLAMGKVVPATLRTLYKESPGTPFEQMSQEHVEFFFTSALNAKLAYCLKMRFAHNINVETFLKQTELNTSRNAATRRTSTLR